MITVHVILPVKVELPVSLLGPAFRPQVLPRKALSPSKVVHNFHTSARATPVASMVYFTVSTTPGVWGVRPRFKQRAWGTRAGTWAKALVWAGIFSRGPGRPACPDWKSRASTLPLARTGSPGLPPGASYLRARKLRPPQDGALEGTPLHESGASARDPGAAREEA